MRRVTLRDIATETEFSINTVSRALNGKPEVGHDTRRIILEKAAELDYRPNKLARGLRSSRTHTLGVIVADVANPYFGGLVKRLHEAARRYNYSIILQDTDEDYLREVEAVQVMLAEHVDGLVITPVQTDEATIIRFKESRLPFVLLGRHFDDLETDYVTQDDEQGGRLATEHLIKRGHERIAFVGGPLSISCAVGRLRGYEQALNEHGICLNPQFVSTCSVTTEDGYNVGKSLVKSKPRPSAIFAFSDFVSLGVMRAIREEGLEIPEDIAIVGYDDVSFASCLSVPLTTVHIPRKEMAEIAVDILRAKIDGNVDGAKHVKLPVELVVRQST